MYITEPQKSVKSKDTSAIDAWNFEVVKQSNSLFSERICNVWITYLQCIQFQSLRAQQHNYYYYNARDA